ncbi:MAG: hypothetical protein JST01_21450 [Cyanobacteria bacterium SZAS TMP-1]|nr:hypothetical protein [Cyanobacteria bacterium SZAS TMP-1]
MREELVENSSAHAGKTELEKKRQRQASSDVLTIISPAFDMFGPEQLVE